MRGCLLGGFLILTGFSSAFCEPAAPIPEKAAIIKADLPGAKDYIDLLRQGDGSLRYAVHYGKETQILTPDEFARLLYDTQNSRSGLQKFFLTTFNITSWNGLFWLGLGILGQMLFAGRMLAQWITSELRGQSIIPVAFWWMSLSGALLMVSYFLWRRDLIAALGVALPSIIYIRNLMLIHRQVAKGGVH